MLFQDKKERGLFLKKRDVTSMQGQKITVFIA
jgi:hypothetical protein